MFRKGSWNGSGDLSLFQRSRRLGNFGRSLGRDPPDPELLVALSELEVFGTDYNAADGSAVRDYVHVGDLAEVHRRAVEGEVTGAFNLGTGKGHSVWKLLVCREVTGHDIGEGCPRGREILPFLWPQTKRRPPLLDGAPNGFA